MELKEKILEILKRQGKVTKLQLVYYTKADERAVRRAIAELRKDGYPICSNSRCKGYWLANSDEDFNTLCAEYASRANDCFETVRKLKAKRYGTVPGQININEVKTSEAG